MGEKEMGTEREHAGRLREFEKAQVVFFELVTEPSRSSDPSSQSSEGRTLWTLVWGSVLSVTKIALRNAGSMTEKLWVALH